MREQAPERLTLDQRLADLRASRGDMVPLDEVGALARALIASLEGDLTPGDMQARHEIEDLLAYLRQARAEIAAIQPDRLTRKDIPSATDELDAVVKATETATFTILNAAEELSALMPDLAPQASEVVSNVVTQIYEASNFQDISGQRITKVVKTLRVIEERLSSLAMALGIETAADDDEVLDPSDPANLLAGPQLPSNASSQDDIDALFDSV